ncbi:MAG: acetyl-CoA acetyltransferase [Frankiales bacterium]|nr:acetyl-CoA acetyltransferase [Frankiales bacterium]
MAEAFIVGMARTAVGRRNGSLSSVHPVDMGAHVLGSLIERASVDPDAVDDVIFGCLDMVGPQSANIARNAWLAAGLPETVAGVTLDRQCGSSQQATHFAAQAVLSGTADLVVAGGVQNMSAIPMMSSTRLAADLGFSDPYSGSQRWAERYGSEEFTQFAAAELIAAKWHINREQMEEYALGSHHRAVKAIDGGVFDDAIAPFGEFDTDECARRDTSLEQMAQLKPLRPDGRLTAAVASQIADGAAAVLVASAQAVADHDLTPRARIHHLAVRGGDPRLMLTAPIEATELALRRCGLTIGDIDRFEVNEAFASVVMSWLIDTRADPARVNVNGGAIALGHPLGATGARLLIGLISELERSRGRYGLLTMCQGGGQANVTIVERL